MNAATSFRARFVESFPTPLQPGLLYVSAEYSTAGHLCACGCGSEIVTKLSPARYGVTFDGEVSLYPSVAATGLPCNSHYFITRGEVNWHAKLNRTEIATAQARDKRAVDRNRPAVGLKGFFFRLCKKLKRGETSR